MKALSYKVILRGVPDVSSKSVPKDCPERVFTRVC